MGERRMHLRLLLPHRVFLDQADVVRIVAESSQGHFGLRPRRLDCAMVLVPGLLAYEVNGSGETFVAVDEGLLVKAGDEVLVAVRNAASGAGLGDLRDTVERQFLKLDERERRARSTLARLESAMVRESTGFRRHG